ncbi:hypothetical protein HMPREF1870_01562 [Bacteroidales bacterium KA00344]|nr:hypothetical protein HMPREF1870_01562 [Bacteroidales bacterium KA00344]
MVKISLQQTNIMRKPFSTLMNCIALHSPINPSSIRKPFDDFPK